jgi:hypothetical protein
VKTYSQNKTSPAFRTAKTRAFTLIQLVGIICIIGAMTSMIVASIRAVSGRADAASDARMKALGPALEHTAAAASWAVTNHNAAARQADRALEMIK